MQHYDLVRLPLIQQILSYAMFLTKQGLGNINFIVKEVDDDEVEEESVFHD